MRKGIKHSLETTSEKLLRIAKDEIGPDAVMLSEHLLKGSLTEDFNVWSCSSKPFQHHYGKGGLGQHTLEVVSLCLEVSRSFHNNLFGYNVDETELFLAALYHDSGKLYDYKPTDGLLEEWQGIDHKRMIHHISRSNVIWTQSFINHPHLWDKYHENVLHAILAHHGSREAGSPVAPKSRVAWLVHFCDGISARMYDADTLDIVKKDKV